MMDMTVEEREQRARELFRQGYNCCQAVAMTFSDVLGMDPAQVARIAVGFGGGMGHMREVCGTVSGMTMVAGALRPVNGVPTQPAKMANDELVQRFAAEFRKLNGSIVCRELLGLEKPEGNAVPEERTPEYYRKRPCGELCAIAAGIVARYIESQK